MSTGDWDLFLGPLEWARAETGGADRWVLLRRGFPGVARAYSSRCPWDTHYQFSIKIEPSKKFSSQKIRQDWIKILIYVYRGGGSKTK